MKRRDFLRTTSGLIFLAGEPFLPKALGDGSSGAESPASISATIVERPGSAPRNKFYVGNRAPLLPSELLPLPACSIQPAGWLKVVLERQRDGMCGHLTEISAWLQKEDNAWLSKEGKGKFGSEEVPYWLRGYLELAYLTKDPAMIAESQVWIEGAIGSQRTNGDFGPTTVEENGARDFWPNTIMLFALRSYYDYSGDPRVLSMMTKYFKFQLDLPNDKFFTSKWAKIRAVDNLHGVYWLYNRTGDAFLLDLATKVDRASANWRMKGNLPRWHNVDIAECFREPATYYLQSHNPADLQCSYDNFNEVRRRYGQVPGGMFGGDEYCRDGYHDPRQCIETCGQVEQMLSDALMTQIAGDATWADHCENVAFNMYPAALTPDMRALRYLTAPNMIASDGQNHHPGVDDDFPVLLMNPFSNRCCQHNHSMGWPYFNKHLWMATPDNGACAVIYSACEAKIKVGDGTPVDFTVDTHYPFEETISIKLTMDKATIFPLYLRIPGWCKNATLTVNGQSVAVASQPGQFVRVERAWRNDDAVALHLPMELAVRTWTENHGSVSVDYGPLTFSLKIGERYAKVDPTKTAQQDSKWQSTADPAAWPAFEIHPTSPWNYGLVLIEPPEKAFQLTRLPWPKDDYPFTPESVPLQLTAEAQLITEWKADALGLCAVLQDSPAFSSQPVQEVALIPMGATRLRISAFPTVSSDAGAHLWHTATNKVI
jgi:hypothetical protein